MTVLWQLMAGSLLANGDAVDGIWVHNEGVGLIIQETG
jgi:hypothetical protein